MMNLWEWCGELTVSDEQSSLEHFESRPPRETGQGFGAELKAGLRARLRQVSEQIKADLDKTGKSIFIDENGNRYLIQREPSTP